MRRALFVLAVTLAGMGWPADFAAAAAVPEPHQLGVDEGATPAGFVRSGSTVSILALAGGETVHPRILSRPTRHEGDLSCSPAALAATTATDSGLRHRAFAARFALLRAGRLSFHAATPPPFRTG